MKKFLIPLLLLALPTSALAAVSATWQTPSIPSSAISPSAINGINQALNITATTQSTLAGSISIDGGLITTTGLGTMNFNNFASIDDAGNITGTSLTSPVINFPSGGQIVDDGSGSIQVDSGILQTNTNAHVGTGGNGANSGIECGSFNDVFGCRRDDGTDPFNLEYNSNPAGRGLNIFGGGTNFGTLRLLDNNLTTIALNSAGTSTFSGNGINVTTGCVAVNGSCLGSGSGTIKSGSTGQSAFYSAASTLSGTSSLVFGTTTLDANNIGIGTSSPFTTLSVNGTSTANLFQFNNGNIFGFSTTTNFWFGSMPTSTNITGQNNLFIGKGTLTPANHMTSGQSNLGLGNGALVNLLSGSSNIGIGLNACGGVIIFSNNTCIGANAGQLSQAANIVFIGANAGSSASTTAAGSSIIIGSNAGRALAGAQNVIIGASAGGQPTTTFNPTAFSVVIGSTAGNLLAGANNSTLIGYAAASSLATGINNTIMGFQAGGQIVTEDNNTFIGYDSGIGIGGLGNGGGGDNTAVGFDAMVNSTDLLASAAFNTAIGESSLATLDTGTFNTALGYQTGESLIDGSYNILIGQNVDATSTTASQSLNIGNVIFGTGMYGGNTFSSTPTGGTIGIGTSSPYGTLAIEAASTTAKFTPIVVIAGLENAVRKAFEQIDQWGHHIFGGDVPTINACTGGSIASGSNDVTGQITVGTGLTSCSILFSHQYPAGTTVNVFLNQNSGTIVSAGAQSISTLGFTITSASVLTGDVFAYRVDAFK